MEKPISIKEKISSPILGGVTFTGSELDEIIFRKKTIQGEIHFGDIIISRWNKMPDGIELLQNAQRIKKVVTEIPRKCIDPSRAGYLHLYFDRNSGLREKLNQIEDGQIQSVLNFVETGHQIKTATIFPNASDNEFKLNGVSIKLDDKKEWWKGLGHFSLGRGLIIGQLDMDCEYFYENYQDMVNRVYEFCKAVSLDYGIKYVQFAEANNGLMLILSSGPTKKEKTEFSLNLNNIKEKPAIEAFRDINLRFADERERLLKLITTDAGIKSNLLINKTYVGVNPQEGEFFSGVIRPDRGSNSPFFQNLEKGIIYSLDKELPIPLGLEPKTATSEDQFIIPDRVDRDSLQLQIRAEKKPIDLDLIGKKISNFEVLALTYHSGWKER